MIFFTGRNLKKIILKISVGIFIFFCLSIVIVGFYLKHGVHIKEISIGTINISNCYLIWNDKLELQIDSIQKVASSSPQSPKLDIETVYKALYTSQSFGRFFSLMTVSNLSLGGKSAEVKLVQETEREYSFTLTTEFTDFESRLIFGAEEFTAELIHVYNRQFNSEASGQVRIKAGSDQLAGTLSAVINANFPVTIDFIADKEQISFEGKEDGEILEIKSLVELFGLSHNIQRWITDYLGGSRYHLKSFKGQLPWNNPIVILDTLEAEVRVDDTEYTFAQGLEPIKAKYTDVFFAKGVLSIKPHDKTFYGQDAGESWLDIDFNDPSNIILNAYIKTSAVANDDILTLLDHYRIPLPFKQISGVTDTNLHLAINLRKRKVEAAGVFEITEGRILFNDTIYKVNDARILLKNSDVTLEQLKVSYKELFVAQVKGFIQAKAGIGDLNILLEQVTLDANGSVLILNDSENEVEANYHFDKQGHTLEAGPSSWLFDTKTIDIGSFKTPVDLADFSLELLSVPLFLPPGVETQVSGKVSIKKKQVDIKCDISKFHVNDFRLLSPHASIDISYDLDWAFNTDETVLWSLSNIPITLYPSAFKLNDQFFEVSNSRIDYGSFFDSQLSGQYNHRLAEGAFYLKNIDVTNKKLEKNFRIDEEALVEIHHEAGRLIVSCPELDLKISSDDNKKWSASFGDLSTIYGRSKLLQKYKIKAGSFTISSENGKRPYNISADIISPYPFLVGDDGPTDNLEISGKLSDLGLTVTVNNNLHVDYADRKLAVSSNNVAYNVPAFISLSKDFLPASDYTPKNKKPLLLSLNAKDSFLYLSPNSKILADLIELKYVNGSVNMRLTHGPGNVVMKIEDEHFMVNGGNFNDAFMGALLKNSIFHGGQMFITAMGDFSELSVLLEIKNTILTNLTTLNNVMELLNTVPSLINFSLPNFNTSGFPIDSAIIGLKFKDKLATFESISFESPLLQGVGAGWVDFSKEQMDLDINLVTQRTVRVGEIPIAGYILKGKEGESAMTMNVKGGFDDPKVKHSLYKDIAAKPFKVLWRTLRFPVEVIDDVFEEDDDAIDGSGIKQKKIIEGLEN